MCERSLSYAKGGATMPVVPPFVRAEMLPSGVLARPYIGGGCSLILLDHYDLKPKESRGRTRHACTQPASVLDILRPLYESPAELADRVTIKASMLKPPIPWTLPFRSSLLPPCSSIPSPSLPRSLHALRFLAQRNDEPAGSQGADGKQRTAWGMVADRIATLVTQPPSLGSYLAHAHSPPYRLSCFSPSSSHQIGPLFLSPLISRSSAALSCAHLSPAGRGFDEAVNGFEDGGWLPLPRDGLDDVTVAVRPVPSPLADSIPPDGTPLALVEAAGTAGILCAKACMRLMNIPPVQLLQHLREHRAEWARPLAGTAPLAQDGVGGLIQTPAIATLLPSVLYAVDVNETLELVRDDSAVAAGAGNGRTADKLLLQARRFLHHSPFFPTLLPGHSPPPLLPSRPPFPPPLAPLAA
eukprot:SM001985S05348  [mRNA]  locus=s1985:165:1722:- [translate_table: standard]